MLNLNTLFVRPAIVLAAASAALSFAAPAMAAPADEAPTALVRLHAADLIASDAATTVHRRIASAARSVCARQGATLQEQMIARQCFERAVRSAEVQLVAQRQMAKGRLQAFATAAR